MLLWLAILAALVSLLKSRMVSRKSLGGEEARAGGEKGAGAERGRRRRTAPERIMRRHASVHPPTSQRLDQGGVLRPGVVGVRSRVYKLLLI